MNRSFLFVPADSERKLQKAAASAADALILDLEDSVSAGALPAARERAAEFVGQECAAEVWVRINPLDSADAVADLTAVIPVAPTGIVLPKPTGAKDTIQLGKLLDVLEQDHGLDPGSTLIMPIATERPDALLRMHDYAMGLPRLAGLTWGAEDLSAALGATTNRQHGEWTPPFQLARTLCLFAASAAEVGAIDTVFTDFRNEQGLLGYAELARRDGFEGMLAIHPAQVPVINDAFEPTPKELERATQIVALFDAEPDAGVLALDGAMIDRPHLLQAQRIIKKAARSK